MSSSPPPTSSPLAAVLQAPGRGWNEVEVYAEVDSTNTLSLAQPRAWRLVVADAQSAARGRRGRAWSSPAGTSVSMSATLPIPDGHSSAGWLTLATGLAVRDAVTGLVPDATVTLKWPNDVLVEGGKVCGILAQSTGTGLVVVGIGLNVAVPAADLPVRTATSLHLHTDTPPTRDAVVTAVADALRRRYAQWAGDDVAGLRREYRATCSTVGLDVVVHLGQGQATGRAIGVDDSGSLVVRTDSGERSFSAGDVVHVRPDPTRAS